METHWTCAVCTQRGLPPVPASEGEGAPGRPRSCEATPEATAGLKLLQAIWPNFLGLALGNFFTEIVTALSVLI